MEVTPGVTVLICGAVGAGKSNLVKALIAANWQKFNAGLVVCPPGSEEDFEQWIPQRWLPGWGRAKDAVQLLVKRQLETRERTAFLILDDCIGTINFNSGFWCNLFITTRHLRITIFVTTQYAAKLPMVVRANTGQAFIFRQRVERSFKLLYESFGQSFNRWQEFRAFIREHTAAPFSCVRYDSKSDSFVDCLPPDMSKSRFRIEGAPRARPRPSRETKTPPPDEGAEKKEQTTKASTAPMASEVGGI
jgi:hypothetical protein